MKESMKGLNLKFEEYVMFIVGVSLIALVCSLLILLFVVIIGRFT